VRRPGIASLAVLALLAVAAPPAAGATVAEPAFCARTTLHDYLAPVSRLPKLRELPYRRIAEPKFRGVSIGASGPALAVGGGSAGYQFQWDKNPDWDVTVKLARVNARGALVTRLGERRFDSVALQDDAIAEPHFGLPERPGFYRTVLTIRSSSGRRLARFGNYFRLIEPKVDMHFTPQSPSYRPGETVFARLENPGAAIALFGESFKVEGLQGETWGPVAAAPGTYASALQWVGAGSTSRYCLTFPIPTALPAGRYRLAQETVISWPSLHGQQRPVLHAEFEVLPGPTV
jgi:hypothetical protein